MNADTASIHTNAKSLLSVKDTKHTPVPDCQSNDFGQNACGEPLAAQHLVVDFTPNEEDTEFIQKKCCAFWDFITSCPELENFVVLPKSNNSERNSRPSDIELAQTKTCEPLQEPVKTAVSMIEFVEEKGLITRAFEAKLPQSGCSVGTQDYSNENPTAHVNDKREEQQSRTSAAEVQEMCRKLRDWDTRHPKSMDPPGHPPTLDEP